MWWLPIINVYFGGSLIQDIQSNIEHEQPNPRNETSHEIQLLKKLLFKKNLLVTK